MSKIETELHSDSDESENAFDRIKFIATTVEGEDVEIEFASIRCVFKEDDVFYYNSGNGPVACILSSVELLR